VFDAKIYKNVGGIFGVSACEEGNKKIFQISDFSFQLSSVLIDFLEKILPILTAKNMSINRRRRPFNYIQGRL
jgi:hypothetical protein